MHEPLLVQHYIDEHARQTPTNVAVIDEVGSIDYGELDALSNRLAQCLRQKGVAKQDRVVFCMKRSVHCLTAILGILKADAIYVPLDPKTPEERWQSIVMDCQPRAIICDESTAGRINHLESMSGGTLIVQLDRQDAPEIIETISPIGWPEIRSQPNRRPDYLNLENDIAYIMYTSGSTGQPKGVMITHRNVRTYIDWAVEYLELCPQDRILSTAPFHFDMSTFDVHCTLKAGGALCVASDLMTMFPERLIGFIEEHEATVWKGVSSLLMYMVRANVLREGRMPTLKTVLFAGEPLPAKFLIRWMDAYPDKQFINAYGPTEATGVSLYHKITQPPGSARERIPIGQPCKDTEVFLLKEDMGLAGEGEIGELCISGPCLAPGYLNDPQKTAQAFVTAEGDKGQRYYRTGDLARLCSDGTYEFISRKDGQVKVMGYRVELGEIEHALMSVDGVSDAFVVTSETEQDGPLELIAYFETIDTLTPAVVMAELRKFVPAYMLPKRVVKVDKIPRTDRGKVARDSFEAGAFLS